MTCVDATCRRTAWPEPGTLNGRCDKETPCQAGLECSQGACAVAGCPTGTLGCPCGVYGNCRDHGGRILACDSAHCVFAGCEAGSAGCTCRPDLPTCDGASECVLGVCRSTKTLALRVANPEARACDVRLDVGDSPVDRVVFDASVLGRTFQRAPRLGVAFMAAQDGPFGVEAVRVELGDRPVSAGPPGIAEAACYDRLGRKLDVPGVSLE
jgi:hypothetical protein